jgi:hypothetical protein|tara:strand:- start:55 stop:180 length:126 start_codon:yes stop_codon:yes gene_type:complete
MPSIPDTGDCFSLLTSREFDWKSLKIWGKVKRACGFDGEFN